MFPAIFLDRDGVIIENRANYVRSWEDVAIYPQAIASLVRIQSSPFKIVIVTNQSAIGRGIISLEQGWMINQRLVARIVHAGGRIDGVYMCPHAPQEGCNCRKPAPGLVQQAAKALSLDLKRSILIGDALSDIEAGRAAGVATTVLVRTGRGAAQEKSRHFESLQPLGVYENLAKALEDLLEPPNQGLLSS